MFYHIKELQFDARVSHPDPRFAQLLLEQFGGANGELSASMQYFLQAFACRAPYPDKYDMLMDIATEELCHLEIVGAMVHQLTRNLCEEDLKKGGFDAYFVDHAQGVYPQAAGGYPYNAATIAVKGDPITDLYEDMAAEQKARTTYDNILRLIKDPDVCDPIRFLRQREIVHFQRFGEALRITQDHLDSKNFYAFNPAFDISHS